MMVDFEKVIYSTGNRYIAVTDRTSPESEKFEIVEFSKATKDILGLGGWYTTYPMIKYYSWDEYPQDPRPQKTRVFVMVINKNIIGYMLVRWHYNIIRHGVILDSKGRSLEKSGKGPVRTKANIDVKPMECWGVDGICILPAYQRRGLGTLLLTRSLKYLKTNICEVAFCPPFTNASEALLRSLGLDPKDARLSLSNAAAVLT